MSGQVEGAGARRAGKYSPLLSEGPLMSDDRNLDRIDQQIRINELREAAKEAAGGEMISWEDPNAPPEIAEQFWANGDIATSCG